MSTPDKQRMAIDVLLAEYKELKAECGGRVQRQSQAFNYFLLSLGVVVSASATVVSKYEPSLEPDQLVRMLGFVVAGLPLITIPLSLIFFDDELIIWASEIYILTRIKPYVNRLIWSDDAEPPADVELLNGTFAWRSLHLKCLLGVNHRLYATGRWALFWLPPTTAFIALTVIMAKAYGTWVFVVALALMLLNALLTFVLAKATRNAITVRNRYCTLLKAHNIKDSDRLLFSSVADSRHN